MRNLFLAFIVGCAIVAFLNPSDNGFLHDFGANIGRSIRFVLEAIGIVEPL